MKTNKLITSLTTAALAALLVIPAGANAMSSSNMNHDSSHSSMKMDSKKSKTTKKSSMNNMDMSHMSMSTNGGKAPKGLKTDKNAKYKVGSKVMIEADHMSGMKGAMATVTGAYNTKLYTIDYKPTNGGSEVKNHKFLVSKEIKAANKSSLKVGEQITVEADHMTGMKGAKGKIVAIENGPAYMVNFKATNSKTTYTNHKWLSQSELTSMK
ncbi:YdhK family protein [Lactobacillaceae bacterium Scapto_B20]